MHARTSNSVGLEEFLQIIHGGLLLIALCAGFTGRPEILTSIRAVLIENPLGIAFATFVIGRRVVMGAVETGVQVRPAAVAFVSEADGLTGREGNLGLAGLTLHAASVLQKR